MAERPQPRAREPKSFRKRTDLAIEIAERKDGDPVRRRISRAASTNGGRVRAAAPRAWGRRHFLAPKFAYLAPRPGALNAPPQMCDPRGAGSIGHAELRAGLRCLRLRPGLHIAPDDFADLLSLYGGDGADGASRRRAPALGVAAALRRASLAEMPPLLPPPRAFVEQVGFRRRFDKYNCSGTASKATTRAPPVD